jgi:alkaline phosphatase D
MPPPMDRRLFLKSASLAAAGLALGACDRSESPSTAGANAPSFPKPGEEPADFDFPLVLALPFAHGVASGDPLADRVILWTRITELAPSAESVAVDWLIASDPAMSQIVKRGRQFASAEHDWTVKVDVTGLQPATSYYYRFEALGAQSIVGRTRTAPATAVTELRLAVLACSSYWSSYWSGLGHLADRNDLDLVVHCGDYIYDFVDEDEGIRARKDNKDTAYVDYRDWLNLAEVRRRYALWRSDPNLLRAHQQHPWFIVWDNHDISTGYGNELASTVTGDGATTTLDEVCRAFYEWTPTRPVRPDGSGEFILIEDGSYPAASDPKFVYRKLPYGPLLDVFGVDTQINLPGYGREVDASHLAAGASLYGRQQFEWFSGGMLASAQAGVTWRLVNNQTWFAPVDIPDVADGIPLPKIGLSRWSDYPEERAALCEYLRGDNPASLRVRNNILVSGDAHGNLGADVIASPALLSAYVPGLPLPNPRAGSTTLNAAAGYARVTTGNLGPVNLRGESVAVEFAPSSMGRGGADEIIQNAIGATGPTALTVGGARALELALIAANKNVQFIEWVDHGYGIVSLTAERAIFEYWWQDKLTPGAPDILGQQMIAWASEDSAQLVPRYQDQLDGVLAHGMAVAATSGSRSAEPAPLTATVLPR